MASTENPDVEGDEVLEENQGVDVDKLAKELDFDSIEEIEIPVRVKGKEYILREASGKAATEYNNASMACVSFGPSGKLQTVKNLASVEPMLVSACLFEKTKNGYKNVPQTTIEGWSNRIKKKLFNTIKEISDITEETKEKKQLELALQRLGAPVDLDSMREWINTLPDDEFKALKLWFKSSEELAKNEQSDTMAG